MALNEGIRVQLWPVWGETPLGRQAPSAGGGAGCLGNAPATWEMPPLYAMPPKAAVPSADGAPTLQSLGCSRFLLESRKKKKALAWDQATKEELLQTRPGPGNLVAAPPPEAAFLSLPTSTVPAGTWRCHQDQHAVRGDGKGPIHAPGRMGRCGTTPPPPPSFSAGSLEGKRQQNKHWATGNDFP